MTNPLIEKIRAARKTQVTVGDFNFTIIRPTDWEWVQLANKNSDDLLKQFVIGWNLKEIDLVPGGMSIPVDFDPALFFEWISDKPECWEPLVNGIFEAYKAHDEKRQEAEKKPENG
jgi:hypothetical protein